MELDDEGTYGWMNIWGETMFSEDPWFDPNLESSQDWRRLERRP